MSQSRCSMDVYVSVVYINAMNLPRNLLQVEVKSFYKQNFMHVKWTMVALCSVEMMKIKRVEIVDKYLN